MENDEETSKLYQSSLQEVEDSRIDDKPLETEELTNTKECEFTPQSLPKLSDSQFVAAESVILGTANENEEPMAEKGIPEVADNELETEEVKYDGDKAVSASPVVKNGEAVAEEENSMAETEMETEAEKTAAKDAQLVVAESPVTSKDDEDDEAAAAAEEDSGTKIETELEVEEGSEGKFVSQLDDAELVGAESLTIIKGEDEMVEEDETPMVETEMETEMDVTEMPEEDKGSGGGGGGGKRKRGRNSGVPVKAPVRRTSEEDVCFICFDGGELVLCDRRGCNKAYHPSCVNRDEAFFRTKGHWNCGWHLCSNCEKNAYYMCYTCTFSLCKGCIKDAVIYCVRGKKGFCESCLKTVMLIENNEPGNKEVQVYFDDKSSWEYLFKDYWVELKAKLSLSSNELAQAKNPWKGSDVLLSKQESPEELYDANNDRNSGSDSSEDVEATKSKRRQAKKRSKSLAKEADVPSAAIAFPAEGASTSGNIEWATKELLEFVMHMKNGDKSILSQFDVQALLLDYIKRNELRDPRRKSQIICDSRLENLFRKARVGHFEMLKLLESHFLIKEHSQREDIQGTVVNTEVNQLEADGNTDIPIKGGKDRRRKTRKKDRGPQSNVDDYAAIDTHNINLIYLRRKLMEDLLEDIENFHDKVAGTFVRIRISGSNQQHDIYRLVQVVGTSKATEPYKLGKRTTDTALEILNLNKTEVISIDTISNQEFTEDECKRLRQSIKCGLINRLTVGDILEKAMEVQAARVNDWMETEIVRISHLRDRASEKGRRKELRECVEKLQLLKTPKERRRRLEEIPEIHADPNMDPSHESEEEKEVSEDNRQGVFARPRGSSFNSKRREPISPRSGSFSSQDSWSGTRKNSNQNWELNRTISNKNYLDRGEGTTLVGNIIDENSWKQVRDRDTQQSNNLEKLNSANNSETVGWNSHSVVRYDAMSDTSPGSLSASLAETVPKISEADKLWCYQDPSGRVQGPFSVVQLRKWSNTGYFPADLRIWRATENPDNSILLTDTLAGRFQKELLPVDNGFMKAQTVLSPNLSSTYAGKSSGTSLQKMEPSSSSGWTIPSVEVSKFSTDQWSPRSRNDSLNLPSPTPKESNPDNGLLTHSSTINTNGSKEHPAVEPIGVLAPTSVLDSGGLWGRGSENEYLRSHTGFSPATNANQGILVSSKNAQLTFQSTGTDGSHAHGWGSGSGSESQAWGSTPAQMLEQNSSIPAPGQPVGYSQWGGVPSIVQNPGGNFQTTGLSALPPTDPWRPPILGSQTSIQPPAPPSVSWGTGFTESNTFAPGPRPDNPSTGWGPVPGNANMGWGEPAPGNINMKNGAIAQGTAPGNANLNWVTSTGNPGAIVQGLLPGNGNPGWVASTGNSGVNVQEQSGNANPSWGAAAGNQGTWERNGDRYSGQRDRGSQGGGVPGFGGGRTWNRQSSFGRGGPGVSPRPLPKGQRKCIFYDNGHCKKGASCDYLHT
ncbi:zinc finger CCCH domain-containing protein 19-like [Cornus florida]|uniref:zinc finger CCCH domain-containing protein 19-like n=1 Tax=Cornus florida TaxID=4283 RepID=UPI00289869DF|nr:zinc finger CCCH domain-containing protein 19-like [Cornus florida]